MPLPSIYHLSKYNHRFLLSKPYFLVPLNHSNYSIWRFEVGRDNSKYDFCNVKVAMWMYNMRALRFRTRKWWDGDKNCMWKPSLPYIASCNAPKLAAKNSSNLIGHNKWCHDSIWWLTRAEVTLSDVTNQLNYVLFRHKKNFLTVFRWAPCNRFMLNGHDWNDFNLWFSSSCSMHTVEPDLIATVLEPRK